MLMWFILAFIGVLAMTSILVVLFIVGVTKSGTGESWLDCSKRLFNSFSGR